MTKVTLVETCRHNLQTSLLAQIGVAKSHTWKQLVQQDEQAEEIVAKVRVEENKPRLEKSIRRAVGCLKITEEKSFKSRIQTPDAGPVIATNAEPRRES